MNKTPSSTVRFSASAVTAPIVDHAPAIPVSEPPALDAHAFEVSAIEVPAFEAQAAEKPAIEMIQVLPMALQQTAPILVADLNTQGTKTMTSNTIDFVSISKKNLEAITTSGKIWTAGVQELTKQFAASTKASIEDSMAAMKAMTSVKSVKEAIDLQTAYSKSVMTKAVAETTKLTEASRRLTEETFAPLKACLTVETASLANAA